MPPDDVPVEDVPPSALPELFMLLLPMPFDVVPFTLLLPLEPNPVVLPFIVPVVRS